MNPFQDFMIIRKRKLEEEEDMEERIRGKRIEEDDTAEWLVASVSSVVAGIFRRKQRKQRTPK